MASAVLLIIRIASPCVGIVKGVWQRQTRWWCKAWNFRGYGCVTYMQFMFGWQAQLGHVDKIQAILAFSQVQLSVDFR